MSPPRRRPLLLVTLAARRSTDLSDAEEVAEDALSLRRAWRTEKKLPILGSGANKIPMIHVSDLAGMVLELAKRRPEDIKSVLAVDKGEATLADCVSAVSKALQSGASRRPIRP